MRNYSHTLWRELNLPISPITKDYVFPKESEQHDNAKYEDHYTQRELINPDFINWAKSIDLGVLRIERFSSKPNYRMYIHTDNDDWIDDLVKIIWCYCPTDDHFMHWYDVKDVTYFETETNNDSGPTMRFPDFNIDKLITSTTIKQNPILANTGRPHNIENGSSYRHVVCAWFHDLKSNETVIADGNTYPKPLQWNVAVERMSKFIL
jgi:hypothetical protein